MDLLDLYCRASAWTLDKATGAATQLDASTPCEEWDVRTLMNHLLETQQYFVGAAQGKDVPPPGRQPQQVLGDDPVEDLRNGRAETVEVFAGDGVIEKTGPALGIAFSDQLLHGWDLAAATGQDARMPEDLAAAAYGFLHGRFTEDQREGVFGPEIKVGPGATVQQQLLAYTGRRPG